MSKTTPQVDPAAVFASAVSLWQACKLHETKDATFDISDYYNGFDQFMREVMYVANKFELWACFNVNFDKMDRLWPYHLMDDFGEVFLGVVSPTALAEFDDEDCLRIAIRLKLPLLRQCSKHDFPTPH